MGTPLEIKQDSARAAELNEETFVRKIAEHRRKLYGIAFSYLHNEADALEALQEASCKAWIKRKMLKEDAAFLPWMIRILINCCMDELRKRKRVVPSDTAGEERFEESRMVSSRRIDLDRALARLPDKYRHVIILKYYHDMTLTEVARVLKKPEGTVKTWLHKALKRMRELL
ncbi:RNA polymerase subunit sigma [Saccharibacillus sp. O23]|uniref:sigma-70 family RNA polymerase sigma factor n=1 Tax=Saccharibacillus sp. O23 TaxID=2009338 RepID=UPI000B4E112E|nr:sigma-70 family RNA polymerase sigma factor [Saccharibacillus sp. O23]OWR27390.1 RNA polymerase subunit sigma [Saccharibacillus sp. O23]